MADIIKLYALETFDAMEPERWPFSVWLPYVQLNSERFLCKETNEIWNRFSSISVYREDDEHPDGDLIEDVFKLPENQISWQGKNGSAPNIGDTFQVLDSKNNIVFEETIFDTTIINGRIYATAKQNAPLVLDALEDMKQLICHIFHGKLNPSLDPPPSLFHTSPKTASDVQTVPYCVRGVPFCICAEEFITEKDCELSSFKNGKFENVPFPAGGHWFEVSYFVEQEPKYARSIGWGEGSAKEIAQKLSNELCTEKRKLPLSNQIQSASTRASEVQSATHVKAKESEPEI